MSSLFFRLLAAILAPAIHEYVKARVSTALGDRTPASKGFLTLNPFKYLEPIGFILMMFMGFGWGKPVPTSALYYKNKRKGILLTYSMPIVANLFVGALAINLSFLFSSMPYVQPFLISFSHANFALAVFNLIPVYPMASNKLLHLFVSPDTSMRLTQYEKPLQMILFIAVMLGLVQRFVFTGVMYLTALFSMLSVVIFAPFAL